MVSLNSRKDIALKDNIMVMKTIKKKSLTDINKRFIIINVVRNYRKEEKTMKDLKSMKELLTLKADKLDIYEQILHSLENTMKWDVYRVEKDEESEDYTYIEPSQDDYQYAKYYAYKEVFHELEDLIVKNCK